MKKIFVALMAVLVLASCGTQKEEKKSVSDVIMMTVEMLNSATEEIKKAETADDVVDVMASMVDEIKEIQQSNIVHLTFHVGVSENISYNRGEKPQIQK